MLLFTQQQIVCQTIIVLLFTYCQLPTQAIARSRHKHIATLASTMYQPYKSEASIEDFLLSNRRYVDTFLASLFCEFKHFFSGFCAYFNAVNPRHF